VALTTFTAGSTGNAAVIPAGIQSNVSLATVNSWGWTEIHRSGADQTVSISSILSAATGDYLMMAVWDEVANVFSILGAGETSVVTAITYQNANSDNGGTTLNNWSNGINFYRTANFGAWGFTSNTVTELNTADIFLGNGLQSQNGQTETVLSKGLSFHIDGPSLTPGWAYNVTGNDLVGISNNHERVFFIASDSEVVPEPSSLLAFHGLMIFFGLAQWRRTRRSRART
jgi:hypothetical protein